MNWRKDGDSLSDALLARLGDLAGKLMRYIPHHNQHAAPIKWAYRDFSHRIHRLFRFTVTACYCKSAGVTLASHARKLPS